MLRSEKKALNRAAHAAARTEWVARIAAEAKARVMLSRDAAAVLSIGDLVATPDGRFPVIRLGRPYYNAEHGFAAWVYYDADGARPAAAIPAAASPAPASRAPRKPQNLIAFLASKGGLRPHGDLSAMDLDKVFVPGAGKLVRKPGSGMQLDTARGLAEEHEFLRPGSDINALLDALADDNSGRRVISERDRTAEEAHQEDAAWQAYMVMAADMVSQPHA